MVLFMGANHPDPNIRIIQLYQPKLDKDQKQQIINWLKSSKELSKIKVRADERYKILEAIVKAIAVTK
ncbi:MAG: hypothetical protein IPF52_10960 [Saprospiraceae bacterium]|nr:hypothetical protein [Saprospiraceae bacterium]